MRKSRENPRVWIHLIKRAFQYFKGEKSQREASWLRFDGYYEGEITEYWFDSYGDKETGESEAQWLRFYADGQAIAVIPKRKALPLDRTVSKSFASSGTWKQLKYKVRLELKMLNAAANLRLSPSNPKDVRYYGYFLGTGNFLLDGTYKLTQQKADKDECAESRDKNSTHGDRFSTKNPPGIDMDFFSLRMNADHGEKECAP